MKKEKTGHSTFRVLFFTITILTVLFTALFSCANVKSKGRTVTITGIVRIEGNEPHTIVILEEAGPGKKRYMLEGELVSKLRNKYQHKSVTIVGYVTGKANPPLFPDKIKVIKILNR